MVIPGDPAEVESVAELPPILKVHEVAEFLRCDPATIYSLVREGDLPVVRLGRTFRVTRDALAQFIGAA